MALNHEQIRLCLDEIEAEIVRLADRKECGRFHADTQFTAVLLLILRCESLLRSLPPLFLCRNIDGFDAVLRAFEETWNLAFEFRIVKQQQRAAKWLAKVKDSWSASIPVLEEFVSSRGHVDLKLGRDYGRLSELAHPTRTAAENSLGLCLVRLGVENAAASFIEKETEWEGRVNYALYKLIWLIADQDSKLIPLYVDYKNLTAALALADVYPDVAPGS